MITVKLEIDKTTTVNHTLFGKREEAKALQLAKAILLVFNNCQHTIKVTFTKNAVI